MALTTNAQTWKILSGIALAITVLVVLAFFFSEISLTIVIGAALILLTEKIVQDHRRRVDERRYVGWKRRAYAYGLVAFWLLTIAVLLSTSIGDLRSAVEEIRQHEKTFAEQWDAKFARYFPQAVSENVNEGSIRRFESYVLGTLEGFFAKALFVLLNGILIIPIMFHLYFRRREQISREITALVPKRHRAAFTTTVRSIGSQLHEFSAAKVYESVIVGGICCLGFYVAGINGWLLLGILAGLLNIIPYIGPIVGAVPPLLIALWLEPPIAAGYVLGTVAIAQLVDNLYLQPFMISTRVRVSPLLTVILLLAGAQVAGVTGMVFALPIYLIYKIVLKESYRELARRRAVRSPSGD